MSVSNTNNVAQYTGDGATTTFGLTAAGNPIPYFAAADWVVNLFDTTANADVAPQPVLGGAATYDYTIGTVSTDAFTGELTGNVVFNSGPLGNHRVTATRAVAATASNNFLDNSKFPAVSVNAQLDRVMMVAQQIATAQGRALKIPASDAVGAAVTLPPAATRANMQLGFDGAGAPIALANIPAAQQVSASMLPVVQAATLAAGRTAFGLGTAAVQTIGTAGATVPLLNGANSFSGILTLNGAPINEAVQVGLASAAATDIGVIASNYANITGNATITSLGAVVNGATRFLFFSGTPLLTNNGNIVLPGGANIQTVAGDVAIFKGDGAWRCISYQRAGGLTPFTKSFQSANQAITLAGALTIAHGLGVQPTLYLAYLKNLTAEGGYSIGDETALAINSGNDGVTPRGLTVVPDATNLNIRFATGAICIANKTTGALLSITLADWALIMRAYA